MEKQKAIEAYRRGLITLQECGQILGADKAQLDDLVMLQHYRPTAADKPYVVGDNM
ncbi:hypothetical protein [Brevibacillus marinus]|uniref:hypothetical protein n=1 Tax=Brevibacillus marinus TaxID=2496837 RepID=UPI0013DF360F|nr:hypothetical protein [Brevibacillus marinus]